MEINYNNYIDSIFCKKESILNSADYAVFRQLNDFLFILIKVDEKQTETIVEVTEYFLFNVNDDSLIKIELPEIDSLQNPQNTSGVFDPINGDEKQAFYDLKNKELYYAINSNEIIIYNWISSTEKKIKFEFENATVKIIKILKSDNFLIIFDGSDLITLELTKIEHQFHSNPTTNTIEIKTKDDVYSCKEVLFNKEQAIYHSYEFKDSVYLIKRDPYSSSVSEGIQKILKIDLKDKCHDTYFLPTISSYFAIAQLIKDYLSGSKEFEYFTLIIQLLDNFLSIKNEKFNSFNNFTENRKINIFYSQNIILFGEGNYIINHDALKNFIDKEHSMKLNNQYFSYFNFYSQIKDKKEKGLLQLLNNSLMNIQLENIKNAFKIKSKDIAKKYSELIVEEGIGYATNFIYNNLIELIRREGNFIDFAVDLLNHGRAQQIIGLGLLKGKVKQSLIDCDILSNVDDSGYIDPFTNEVDEIFDSNEQIPFKKVFTLLKNEYKNMSGTSNRHNSDYFEKILSTCASWSNTYSEEIFRWIYSQKPNKEIKIILLKLIADYKILSLNDIIEKYLNSKDKKITIAAIEAVEKLGLTEYEMKIIKFLKVNDDEINRAALSYLKENGSISSLDELIYYFIVKVKDYDELSLYDKPEEIILEVVKRVCEIEKSKTISDEKISNYLLVGYLLLLYLSKEIDDDSSDEDEFVSFFNPEGFRNIYSEVTNYGDLLDFREGNYIQKKIILNLLKKVVEIEDKKIVLMIALIISLKRGFILYGKKDNYLQKIIFYLKEILENAYSESSGLGKKLACAALLEIGADKKYEKLVWKIIETRNYEDYPIMENLLAQVVDYSDPINKLPIIIRDMKEYIKKKKQWRGSKDYLDVLDKKEVYEKRITTFLTDIMVFHLTESGHSDLEAFFNLLKECEIYELKGLAEIGLNKLVSKIN